MESDLKYNIMALSDFDPKNFKSMKLPKNGFKYPEICEMQTVQKGDVFEIPNDEKVDWWIRAKKVKNNDTIEVHLGLLPSSLFVPVNPLKKICLDSLTEEDKEFLIPNIGRRERKYFPLCSQFYGKLVKPHENTKKTHSFFSRLFYSWITPYILLGFKRHLIEGDLWTPVPSKKTKSLKNEFNSELKNKSREKPPIFTTFLLQNKKKFILGAVCKLSQDAAKFLTPFLIRVFINYSANSRRAFWNGIGLTFCLFFFRTLDSFLLNKFFEYVSLMGVDFRCILSSLVYQKLFSIRPVSLNKYTQSFQTNLVSVDSYLAADCFIAIIMNVSFLAQIIACFIYLYLVMGLAFLPGLAVIIIILGISFILVKSSKPIQVKQMAAKDSRIKMITTMFIGINLVKLYSWEHIFAGIISKIRNSELKEISKINLIQVLMMALVYIMPFSITLATFITFIKIRGQISAAVAFESISIFGILRIPFMILPESLKSLVAAKVSYKRFVEFLSQPDTQESLSYQTLENPKNEPYVKILNGTFTFDEDLKPFLTDVNIQASSKELHVIVGENGSGKTKLLQSILNENIIANGRVEICGKISYVPQNPWIKNLSLKENILDGNPSDRTHYDTVIELCQLIPDIELLPNGDETEIGENGINLSGGQKQRVGLARALYTKADIYLLDDPFSNLDKYVGQQIFQKIISSEGCLKDSVRILITHDDRFLSSADYIHLIRNGKIVNCGTYNDLIVKDQYFSDFISKLKYLQDETSADIHDYGPNYINARQVNENAHKKFKGHKLVETDTVMKGGVKGKIYWHYIKSQSLPVFVLFLLCIIIYYAITTYGNIVVANYTSYYLSYNNSFPFFRTYGLVCVAQLLIMTVVGIFQVIGIYLASKHIHIKLLSILLRSPLAFFESTRIGRIVNAFSTEMSVLDSKLSTTFKDALILVITMLFSISSIVYFMPFTLIGIIILIVLYLFVLAFYIKSSRQLQRLESLYRSPILSHLLDTIKGMSILRSNHSDIKCTERFDELLDLNSVPFKMNMYSKRWLDIRLELIGNFLILISALSIVITCFVSNILPGVVGYILFASTFITKALSFFIKYICDLENQIVSIERISAFYQTQPENETMVQLGLSPSWPEEGKITFVNYSCKYHEDLPDVLHGLNFTIEPRQKVGIAGRTGSGKSSIVLSLFRMIKTSKGCINIDGVDITDISLKRLRESLTIIPQDAFAFKGTLRENIDPANQFKDSQIMKAVELSQLSNLVKNLSEGLDYVIDETGSNVSSAEKQLICLARALLKHTKILILDEATSNVDLKTDKIIQEVISREFEDCTVITIAHRIETIINYEKILVLDDGHVAEFGSPSILLSNKNSLFYSIASQTNSVL